MTAKPPQAAPVHPFLAPEWKAGADRAAKVFVGSLLRCPGRLKTAEGEIKIGDLEWFPAQETYRAIRDLAAKGRPITAESVYQWAVDHGLVREEGPIGEREIVGAPTAGDLAELFGEGLPELDVQDEFRDVVRELVDRAVVKALYFEVGAWMSREIAVGGAVNRIDDIIRQASQRLFEASQRRAVGSLEHVSAAVDRALDGIDLRSGKKGGEVFEDSVPTGWDVLDKSIPGWRKGELIVLAARPSVGKTLFAGNAIARACKAGKRVFFASLEQGAVEIVERMLAAEAPVNGSRLRKGDLQAEHDRKLLDASQRLRDWPLWFNDSPRQKPSDILAHARRLQAKEGLDLVVVDYLQIVTPEVYGQRYEQVGDISRKLKQMARELKVPVMALAQLGRGKEDREPPSLRQLRESGNIEQDADVVIGLHKPEPPDGERKTDILELHVLKQRSGPTGVVTLYHKRPTFSVVEEMPFG